MLLLLVLISIYKLYPFLMKHSQTFHKRKKENSDLYLFVIFYEYLLSPSASYAYMVCSSIRLYQDFLYINVVELCNLYNMNEVKVFWCGRRPPRSSSLSCFVKCSYNIFINIHTKNNLLSRKKKSISFLSMGYRSYINTRDVTVNSICNHGNGKPTSNST